MLQSIKTQDEKEFLYEKQITRFLDHAASALEDAGYLYEGGRSLALANRAYYAIFYCIYALLLTENVITKKHEGARVKFHQLFVKTGRFPIEAGKILERNFEARQSADYDMESELDLEEAVNLLNDAREFYALTLTYFAENPIEELVI